MNMMKMCLNPKVIAGLALAGGLVLVLAPHLLIAVLPLLLIAACPLSMLLMVFTMRGHNGHQAPERASKSADGGGQDEVAAFRAEVATLRLKLDPTSDAVSGADE